MVSAAEIQMNIWFRFETTDHQGLVMSSWQSKAVVPYANDPCRKNSDLL